MTNDKIIEHIGEEWFSEIGEEFNKEYMSNIRQGLRKAKNDGRVIYPESKNIFRAFRETPYSKVKVLLLGQDPYHDGNACGLSFSTPKNNPSLRQMLKEFNICFPDNFNAPILSGDLTPWAQEGVLLLNAALTVPKGSPGKHMKYWEPFTEAVFAALDAHPQPIVFLLLGKFAHAYGKYVKAEHHTIINVEHPAASVYQGRNWNADGIYLKINKILEQAKRPPVLWDTYPK